MAHDRRFDPASLFGCLVVDGRGNVVGRVTALIHRGDGCDVLVERRRWLRHVVTRLDLADVVESGQSTYRHVRSERRSPGPRDGWVA